MQLEFRLPRATSAVMRHCTCAAVWSLAMSVLACTGSGPKSETQDAGVGTRVVLGTGEADFEALADEASIPLIRGVQGAFHIWTSFLAYGFDTDVLRMDLTTHLDDVADSELGAPGNVAVRSRLDAEGVAALASVGWPAIVARDALCLHGRGVRVELEVLDTEGHTAHDSRHWILDVAEEDRASDCAR
jgi:hypothetical protein